MSIHYTLHVLRAHDVVLGQKLSSGKGPNLYVRVKLGDRKMRTHTIKGELSPAWNDALMFAQPDPSAPLIIELRHESRPRIRADRTVARREVTLTELLEKCGDEDTSLDLLAPGNQSMASVGILRVRLQAIHPILGSESGIKSASEDVRKRLAGSDQRHDGESMYHSLENLCSQLDSIMKSFDEMSKIHPYANIAWLVASALYKAVSHQIKVDKQVVELVQLMEDAFDFARDVQSLPNKAKKLERTVIELLSQTTECCLFVREYIQHGFLGRMLNLDYGSKIDEFKSCLTSLKAAVDSGVLLHVSFVSSRISQKIDDMVLRHRLSPVMMDAFDRPLCLPGTRVEVQKQILEWSLSETKENILWLYGVAGSGKSTISTTIAEYFRGLGRLGAFMFFERGKSEPTSVVRTLAFKLALFDSNIGSHVLSAVTHDKDVATASSMTQFETLIIQPLVAAADVVGGPIMIVFDALDECGAVDNRHNLLQLFERRFPELPDVFRFIITSRREADISKALSSRPDRVRAIELDYASTSSRNDVLSYIHHEMHNRVRDVVVVPKDWPWDESMSLLGSAAAGLFIWAATAVKFVSSQRDDPFQKLKDLVSDLRSLGEFGLQDLYATVLQSSGISWHDTVYRNRFTQVLGLILLGKVPLSIAAIDGFLGFPPEKSSNLVLSRLQSLLEYTPDGAIRIFHASLSDYLTSPERSGDPWYINVIEGQSLIASRCLVRMVELLRFNICDIESSDLTNDRIPNLQDRVKENIPSYLEYSCCYWALHLREVPYSGAIDHDVSRFLHTCLLYWLEVLSLLKLSKNAKSALLDAMSWISDHDIALFLFAKDAYRSITLYEAPIARSAPHIYVSMLPTMATESRVLLHYVQDFSSLVQFGQNEGRSLSPLTKVSYLQETEGSVSSMGISSDGSLVVTGRMDGTIQIWDHTTRKHVGGHIRGHSDTVWALAFSRDSSRVISSSEDGTIIIWDAATGELVSGPFIGHEDSLDRSVAFSEDGSCFASGARDGSVSVWSGTSGDRVYGPFIGHTQAVWSVCFSPGGKTLASGSRDYTIRIWDVQTGNTVTKSFEGHSNAVSCLVFSRDGSRIVSGSEDQTIIVWDAETGMMISGPFVGHTKKILCVMFTHDEMRIISGSEDDTLMTWEEENGRDLPGLLDETTFKVMSVAFSTDDTCIALGLHNGIARIINAKTGEIIYERTYHADGVTAISFSLDNLLVASGSMDGAVMVWDLKTGEAVAGPFIGHRLLVSSVAFSSDAKLIASGSWDSRVVIWDIESAEKICEPLAHDWGVSSVAFLPDGSRVISSSGDKTIRIWGIASAKLVCKPFEGHTGEITCMCLSPDGERVVSGSLDKTIRIWDVKSGETVVGPISLPDAVRSVSFSRDASLVLSGAWDCAVRVWDASDGSLLHGPFEGHTDRVIAVAASSDGSQFISAGKDNTIRVWNAPDRSSEHGSSEHYTFNVLSIHPSSQSGIQSEWTLGRDGWVMGTHGELLLWLPHHLRARLWRPSNLLSFAGSVRGERWYECYKPSRPAPCLPG